MFICGSIQPIDHPNNLGLIDFEDFIVYMPVVKYIEEISLPLISIP
jgi:hypothetical protein